MYLTCLLLLLGGKLDAVLRRDANAKRRRQRLHPADRRLDSKLSRVDRSACSLRCAAVVRFRLWVATALALSGIIGRSSTHN